MNAKSDDRAATAAKLRPARAHEPSEAPRPDDDPTVPAPRRGVRTRPFRSTVDLSPAQHHALTEWAEDTRWSSPGDQRRITRQAVLAALVAELLVDETLSRKIRRRLADD